MKKMIIMLAVVVAAVAANAASFKWSAGNVYSSNLTDKYSGAVTLYAVGIEGAISTATAANGVVAATTFSSDAFTAGQSYDFFFVIEDGESTFTSVVKNVDAQADATANIAFGNMATQTQTAANWTTASVPEPTSGLLMLVGLAGLALRRRCA
jgi:hypothetical protein